MKAGSHVSIAGGLHKAFGIAQKIGCEVIQIFSKNATRWKVKPLQEDAIAQFLATWKDSGISTVVVHNSYLINLGTPKEALLQKSREAMLTELQRCEQLHIPYLVMHPGSHTGSGEEQGLQQIAASLDTIHEKAEGFSTQILLEITAGQGTNLGYSFEQLARILERLRQPERVGVCFDTCHAFAAGYELRTEAGYQQTFESFERILGLERLKVFHLNDSVQGLGSKRDRHETIGAGSIGLEGFRLLVNDPRFESVPMILETPKGDDPIESDRRNLEVLRGLIRSSEA